MSGLLVAQSVAKGCSNGRYEVYVYNAKEAALTNQDRGQQDWILLDRIARSLAHLVGNAISVVSGRLGLVESDETLSDSARGSIHRAQERLKRLHTDLRGALKFSARPEEHIDARLSDTLALLRDQGMITSQDWPELVDCAAVADGTLAVSSLPLLRMNTAYCKLSTNPVPWGVSRTPLLQAPAITLHIPFRNEDLPADRRALTEPWFSREAQSLPSATRYGRLLLAESLALLEEAQVAVSIEAGASPADVWSLVLVWPLKPVAG